MAIRPRIAFATCSWLPKLTPDDHVLRTAVASAGMRAVPSVWDDENVDWHAFDGCVLRSPWDYHTKREAFVAWAAKVAEAVPMFNSARIIAWNTDKNYLRTLAERGVPTIPTYWVQRGAGFDLAALRAARSWREVVIKPTVGLGALNLHRVQVAAPDAQQALDDLLRDNDVMVQPYLTSVERRGEVSLVYVNGEISHAVRKTPRPGDFRVQPMWGGSVAPVKPQAREREVAERALAEVDGCPLYARVDLVEDDEGQPCLIELELVDPNLFFGAEPGAARCFAAALRTAISA